MLAWYHIIAILFFSFCSFQASRLQQILPQVTVMELKQAVALREHKQKGTTVSNPCPPSRTHEVSVLVFSDAGRLQDYDQLSYLAGILIGPVAKDSTFYTISWMSHKSKRPVR